MRLLHLTRSLHKEGIKALESEFVLHGAIENYFGGDGTALQAMPLR